MKIALIAGARPNFMKIAPILRAMRAFPKLEPYLVHTGQHYDYAMSEIFFKELGIPEPDVNLEVGSASQSVQTAKIMIAFEEVVTQQQFDLVLVVGDVTSTMACTLVSAKLQIPVAHVEAGIRSFDRTMPEEINRIVTDTVADYLFPPSEFGVKNLRHEGIPDEKIFLVGDVMIDTLMLQKDAAAETQILAELDLQPRDYVLMTMHRPHNVDNPDTLKSILGALQRIQAQIQILFPIHPRTRSRIEAFGLTGQVDAMTNLRVIEPIGYLQFLNLMMQAKFVLTDSGGMQEETTVLGVPCLTLRENTERPETVEHGTNTLVGSDSDLILRETAKILSGNAKQGHPPELWDGHAAERIAETLAKL
ncbi:MAG: UDP-N-acetylglucosamine 2-epimerase (non-hydrolyzing) [Candidatus Poribacteria bacterium]|nr:UDP-N-acetylglucosamine 2-epimerase (non-hydrolyzing) [Candidatus Poribacteria bacterium]